MPNKDGTGPKGNFKKCPAEKVKKEMRNCGKGLRHRNRRGQK